VISSVFGTRSAAVSFPEAICRLTSATGVVSHASSKGTLTVSDQRKIPDFQHTGFNSPITEVAVMLVAQKDGTYSSLGSGVIIGPTIAITARHVVDAFSRYHEGLAIEQLGSEGTFSLQAIQFLENGTKGLAWDVRQIYVNPDPTFTDIVFLRLQPTSNDHIKYEWKKVRMQLLPPNVGTIVSAFGYHSTSVATTESKIELDTNPYTTSGRVEEIHHERRDAARLSFPCFRTNARFDPGMSGGPVFSEEGRLCGIICSNMPPDTGDPDGEHISYVSTLWPSMGILVSFDREGCAHGISYPAFELATGNFIEAVDKEKVSVSYDAATNTVTV
jgi:hypothetical protein